MKFIKVPVLRIKQCPDTSRWYKRHVGHFVPHRAWNPEDGYKSTEPGGYTNYVRTQDAEPTTALVRVADLHKWPYNHVQLNATKPVTMAKPLGCAGSCKDMGICQAPDDCRDKAAIDAELTKAKGQSHAHSWTEAAMNIAVGFAVSVVITALVLPAYGHHVTLSENLQITAIFTVSSLLRSYALRRFFNHITTREAP